MKTHALAKGLRYLADILESHPNTELSRLQAFEQERRIDPRQVALSLSTLHALSKIKKQEWEELIHKYNFQININPRDSARNIMGKLLKHLDNNPEAATSLKTRIGDDIEDQPSALREALRILLEGDDYERPN